MAVFDGIGCSGVFLSPHIRSPLTDDAQDGDHRTALVRGGVEGTHVGGGLVMVG